MSITVAELMTELAIVRETLETERSEAFGQWQRDDRIIHELRGQVEREGKKCTELRAALALANQQGCEAVDAYSRVSDQLGEVGRAGSQGQGNELTPVPSGMSSGFYQFMSHGCPRSDSGELLMAKPINPAEAAFREMMADDLNRSEMEKLGLSERQLLFVYAMGWIAGRHDGERGAQADGT